MDQIELGRVLGEIQATLKAHTEQDAANFAALNARLDKFDVEPLVRRVAVKWAAGAGAVIALAAQVASALGLLP